MKQDPDKTSFSFLSTCVRCFFAVEAGALAICVLRMAWDGGLIGILDGVAFWGFGQVFVMPIALFAMVPGALLRFVLGHFFENLRLAAIFGGLCFGVILTIVIVGRPITDLTFEALVQLSMLGGLSGAFAGWVWYRLERLSMIGVQG